MAVRTADAADAAAIATVQVESWDATYRGLMPDRAINGMTVAARTSQWDRALAAGNRVFVATHGEEIVGFCSVGASAGQPGIGEITAMYAVQEAWGKGHGRRLMRAATGWFRERGFSEAVLWVLDTNRVGRSFYEKAGWHPDGLEKVDLLHGAEVNHVRYRTDL